MSQVWFFFTKKIQGKILLFFYLKVGGNFS